MYKEFIKCKCKHNYNTGQFFGRCIDNKFNCKKIRNIKEKVYEVKSIESEVMKICSSSFYVDWITFILNKLYLIEVKDE